jgi:hypothetical protein
MPAISQCHSNEMFLIEVSSIAKIGKRVVCHSEISSEPPFQRVHKNPHCSPFFIYERCRRLATTVTF